MTFNVTLDGESNDDLFVVMGASTAIQVDNFDDLLHGKLCRYSIGIHESVDSWCCDEIDNQTIEVDEDYWMFDGNDNAPWVFG